MPVVTEPEVRVDSGPESDDELMEIPITQHPDDLGRVLDELMKTGLLRE
jgi:predicted RNA-binding protein YlqC (UPF0109 family)